MSDVQLNTGDKITVKFLGDELLDEHTATVIETSRWDFTLKFADGDILKYNWPEIKNMHIQKQKAQPEIKLDPTSNLMLEVVELRAKVAKLEAQNRRMRDTLRDLLEDRSERLRL